MKRFIYTLIISSIVVNAAYSKATSCTDESRECLESVASSYLHAILTHDAKDVPLAADAQRWENGVNTGTSGMAIRDSLNNDYGLKAAKDIRELRWVIDGNQAMAIYLLDTVIPYTNIHVSTTRISERFQIVNGLINEVDVVFCNSPGVSPEPKNIPRKTSTSFICTRSI